MGTRVSARSLHCIALNPNISILIYGRNCWFQFLFSLSLFSSVCSMFIVAFSLPHFDCSCVYVSVCVSALKRQWLWKLWLDSGGILHTHIQTNKQTHTYKTYRKFSVFFLPHYMWKRLRLTMWISVVTKEMQVFTIYLHEHGLSMNYRKSVLIYGGNVARNTLHALCLTSFVFIHLHFLQSIFNFPNK